MNTAEWQALTLHLLHVLIVSATHGVCYHVITQLNLLKPLSYLHAQVPWVPQGWDTSDWRAMS